jgi:hypothetical protein
MRLPRPALPAALLLVLLVACTATIAPTSTPTASAPPAPTPAGTPDPAADSAAREAFVVAICPVMVLIADADTRLITLRQVGTAGGDVNAQAGEVADVGEAVEDILNDLDALPDWTYGRRLRVGLIGTFHDIRVALAGIDAQLSAGDPDAAEGLAAIPFIVDDGVELGMNQAVEAGLMCQGAGS